jgi:hypothetical protein
VATFIEHVRCGGCEACLTLETDSVVLQQYRRQPWLRHFWVRCDVCAAHKLYWPTPRQVRLAERMACRVVLDEVAPGDVSDAYARSKGFRGLSRRAAVDIPNTDIAFLLSMLAVITGVAGTAATVRTGVPTLSYLPASWAN